MGEQRLNEVRAALVLMAHRHTSGIRDGFSCPPECATFAKAVVDSIEANGGPCPRLLGEHRGVSLTFMLEDRKLFYSICDTEIDVYAFSKAYFGDALNDQRELPHATPSPQTKGEAQR